MQENVTAEGICAVLMADYLMRTNRKMAEGYVRLKHRAKAFRFFRNEETGWTVSGKGISYVIRGEASEVCVNVKQDGGYEVSAYVEGRKVPVRVPGEEKVNCGSIPGILLEASREAVRKRIRNNKRR